ncbi:MAG: glycoside hydrolase family 5 protein [Treponema sp.]|jgi:endoglucanase|nr:glycoside hydrolase family 5 protein [Treponema sp.]
MKKILFAGWFTVLVLAFFTPAIITACKTQKQEIGTNSSNKEFDRNWKKNKIRENLTTQNLIEEMGIGINMGNTLEACGDWIDDSHIDNYIKAWGSPIPTEEMIAGYAKAGFSSLRIPVAWSNMMRPDGYIINPDLFKMVEDVVNWTIDNGMVALINLHWDGGWWSEFPDKHDEVMEKYVAIWRQICGRFRNYGDRLIFENMNEVGFDSIWTPWRGGQVNKIRAFNLVNELNQVFVDTVRASGGNNAGRHLLINVYNTGLEYAYDPLFKIPSDPANRMALSVHYYTPAVFAILEADADWGKARTTWGTTADLKELNDNMDLLKKNCVDKGIPVIIGEFAACGNNKAPSMKHLYALTIMEAVLSREMCPMLWDTPGGEYDRYEYYLWSEEFEEAVKNLALK